LARLQERISGRKNERDKGPPLPWLFEVPPTQAPGPATPEVPASEAPASDAPAPRIRKKPSKPPRRRNLAEANDLPMRTLHCQADPNAACPRCQGALRQFGTAESWRAEWVPGHFERIQILQDQCACPTCPDQGVLVVPEPPFAIPKAMCGNGLLARVIVDKFADHLPLNRQARRLAREGFDVGSQTLALWITLAAEALAPIVEAIDAWLLAQPWLQGDDTGFPIQSGGDGELRRCRLWCYTDQQMVRYHFTTTKAGSGPVQFLEDFAGDALLVDLGSEFNAAIRAGNLDRAGCWSHLRRYFFEARHHHPAETATVLQAVRELFAVEAQVWGTGVEAVRVAREQTSRPLVDALFTWMGKLCPTIRPTSLLGKALAYASNHEAAFRLFLDRPDVPMHNNLSELQLRQPVVGRKNWLFARTEVGGHAAASLYTLIGSCVLQGIDPWAYIFDVLNRVRSHPANRMHELTPRSWRIAREAAAADVG